MILLLEPTIGVRIVLFCIRHTKITAAGEVGDETGASVGYLDDCMVNYTAFLPGENLDSSFWLFRWFSKCRNSLGEAMTPAGFAEAKPHIQDDWAVWIDGTLVGTEMSEGYAKDRAERVNESLNAAVSKAVQEEREECVKVAHDFSWKLPLYLTKAENEASDDAACSVSEQIAEAIRSRGK